MTKKIKTIDPKKVKYKNINNDDRYIGVLEGFFTEDGEPSSYYVCVDGSLSFVVHEMDGVTPKKHTLDMMIPRINMAAQSPNK